MAASAHADGTRYVGGGRYLCTGSSAKCAIVKQSNRILSRMEREARKPAPYLAPDPTFRVRGSGGAYVAPKEVKEPAPIVLEPKYNLRPEDF